MANMSAVVPAPTLLPAPTNKAAYTAESQPSFNANAASNVAPNPTANDQDNLRLSQLEDKLAKIHETP